MSERERIASPGEPTILDATMLARNVTTAELATWTGIPIHVVKRARRAYHKLHVGHAIRMASSLREEVEMLFADRV